MRILTLTTKLPLSPHEVEFAAGTLETVVEGTNEVTKLDITGDEVNTDEDVITAGDEAAIVVRAIPGAVMMSLLELRAP